MCERCVGLSRRGLLGAIVRHAGRRRRPGTARHDHRRGGAAPADGRATRATAPTRRMRATSPSGRAARVTTHRPIASVLSCSDARVGPEFVFDQGPGDLFVVRVAGNVLLDEGLASLEYAAQFLGAPLIFVLGHSNCGAVEAAIKVVKDNAALPGHLPGLIDQIKPAVLAAQAAQPGEPAGRGHRRERAADHAGGRRGAAAAGRNDRQRQGEGRRRRLRHRHRCG